jgi:hypothetical protein
MGILGSLVMILSPWTAPRIRSKRSPFCLTNATVSDIKRLKVIVVLGNPMTAVLS